MSLSYLTENVRKSNLTARVESLVTDAAVAVGTNLIVGNDLTVTNDAIIDDNLAVGNDVSIIRDLTVGRDAEVDGNLIVLGTISGGGAVLNPWSSQKITISVKLGAPPGGATVGTADLEIYSHPIIGGHYNIVNIGWVNLVGVPAGPTTELTYTWETPPNHLPNHPLSVFFIEGTGTPAGGLFFNSPSMGVLLSAGITGDTTIAAGSGAYISTT